MIFCQIVKIFGLSFNVCFRFQAVKNLYPPKKLENLRNFEKKLEKKVAVKKISSAIDTEPGPWFQFPIPKLGFSRSMHSDAFSTILVSFELKIVKPQHSPANCSSFKNLHQKLNVSPFSKH